MKTPEEIKRLRENSARLLELGIPAEKLAKLNDWIDRQEEKPCSK